MDCAITSLFPGAGGPPPADGGEAPAGSGAELAALFASIVAGLGAATPESGEAAVSSEPDEDPVDSLAAAAADEETGEATITVPAVAVWLAQLPAEPGVPLNLGDGSMLPAAAPLTTAPGDQPGAGANPVQDLASALPAGDVEAQAPSTAAVEVTEAIAAASPAPAGAADSQEPVRDRAQRPPAGEIPPRAARALARALAALQDPQGQNVPAEGAASAAAAGTPPVTVTPVQPQVPSSPAGTGQAAGDTSGATRPGVQPHAIAAVSGAFDPGADPGADSGEGDTGGSQQQPRDLSAPTPVRGTLVTEGGEAPLIATPTTAAVAEHRPTVGAQGQHESPAAAYEAEIRDQVVQTMRVQVRQGNGEARLRLNPEFLGELKIELKISGDRVSAVLHVERDDVRQQIESGTSALRAALAAQGLELEELTVREDGASRREGSPQERREPQGRRRQRPPSEAFEIPD